MEQPTVTVVLELESGPPVCGSLSVEGETATRFDGMLELLSLLESARPKADSTPATGV